MQLTASSVPLRSGFRQQLTPGDSLNGLVAYPRLGGSGFRSAAGSIHALEACGDEPRRGRDRLVNIAAVAGFRRAVCPVPDFEFSDLKSPRA